MKRQIFFFILLIFGLFLLILFPNCAADAVRSGLILCASTVIPALFPFMVVSRLLLSVFPARSSKRNFTERCFGVGSACLPALFISFLGGYPIGVSSVVSLFESGRITKQDAARAIRFCNNSGPGFFVGILGGAVFGSLEAGIVLYFIHILSAVLTGRFFSEPSERMQLRLVNTEGCKPSGGLLQSIADSCQVLLQLCGMIVFFSLLSAFLDKLPLPPLPNSAEAILFGAIELTTGTLHLSDSAYSLIAASFLMGWGGLCVHMQAKSIWTKAGIVVKNYYTAKLLQGSLSAIFTLTYVFPTPKYFLLSLIFALMCIFFPYFRKKYSGNLRRNLV